MRPNHSDELYLGLRPLSYSQLNWSEPEWFTWVIRGCLIWFAISILKSESQPKGHIRFFFCSVAHVIKTEPNVPSTFLPGLCKPTERFSCRRNTSHASGSFRSFYTCRKCVYSQLFKFMNRPGYLNQFFFFISKDWSKPIYNKNEKRLYFYCQQKKL